MLNSAELRDVLVALAREGNLLIDYLPGLGGGPGDEGAAAPEVTVRRDGYRLARFYGFINGVQTVAEAIGCDPADLTGYNTRVTVVNRNGRLAVRRS